MVVQGQTVAKKQELRVSLEESKIDKVIKDTHQVVKGLVVPQELRKSHYIYT